MSIPHSIQHPTSSVREFTILMALLISIVAISIDALLPALGLVAGDLHLSNPNHAQYLITMIFAGLGLGELVSGPLSDALGRKPVLYFGIVLYLVGSIICYFANTLDIMLLGRFIQGVGVSGPYVSAVSIVRDKYVGAEMARIMSLVMMIFIVVPAVAPSLGQAIIALWSWRAIFILYIVYSMTVLVWICIRLEETLPPERRIPFHAKNIVDGFREVLTCKKTVAYMICMGFCFGGFMGFLSSSQQIFQDQFQTGNMFALYFGVLAASIGAASLFNAKVVEKLGMYHLVSRSFIAITAASALILAVHAFVEIELWMFMLYGVSFFFSFGLIFGNLNAMSMEPMGHVAGIASAVIGAVSSVMSVILGSLIGQLYNGTIIPIASGFLIFSILCLGIVVWVNRQKTEEKRAF